MQEKPKAPDQDDTLRLGQLALARKLITPEQLRTALAEHARSLTERKNARPLGNILIEKHYLTNEQLISLLDEQRSKAAAPAAAKKAPSHAPLGKYEVVRELGRGGMGVVYEAVDTALNRKVALKMMLTSSNADAKEAQMEEERFLRESRLCASLAKHPHIVSVYEAGIIEGKRYLAMELIQGTSFSHWKKAGSVTIRQQVKVLRDVALAVHHAHKQGTIHRDLKPDNILIDQENQPHVTDFGLAKSVGQNVQLSLTASGMIMGTPSYMSPEQAMGEKTIDHRTDIYALGVMLYHTLTGRLPFTGETAIEILMKASKNPVPAPSSVVKPGANPTLDKAIENICLKSLAKKAQDRYATAEAFANDLTKWLKGEEVQVRVAASTRRSVVQAKKPTALIYAGIGGGALLILVLAFLSFSRGPSQDGSAQKEAERKRRENAQLEADKVAARKELERLKGERDRAIKDVEEARKKSKDARTQFELENANEALKRAEERTQAAEASQRKKEEELKNSQNPPPATPAEAAGPWINLLPLIDPEFDSVVGLWKRDESGLVSDGREYARLEIAYEPPEEYDFRVRFTLVAGSPKPSTGGDVVQLVPCNGISVPWQMGGYGNTLLGFGLSGPAGLNSSSDGVRREECLKAGRTYESVLKVRNDGMSAFFDGAFICKVPRDFRPSAKEWALRDQRHLGVADYLSVAKFSTIEVLEVTGKGVQRAKSPKKVDDAWQKSVASLPPEDQLAAVVEKLRELNPSFDGRVESKSGGDGITELAFFNSAFRDISPLAALKRLEKLDFGDSNADLNFSNFAALKGMPLKSLRALGMKVLDLSYLRGMPLSNLVCTGGTDLGPLSGMPLEVLYLNGGGTFTDLTPLRSLPKLREFGCNYSRVSDLAPLAGLRLERLDISHSEVSDLSPLRNLPLSNLNCSGTRVTTLAPLKGLPLKVITCDFFPERDTQVLKSIKSLETINGQAVVEFWKTAEPGHPGVSSLGPPRSLVTGSLALYMSVVFTSDSKRCASGCLDQRVRIWDVATGRQEREIVEGSGVLGVALRRPDDKLVASGDIDGTVKLWDTSTGTLVRILQGHASMVNTVAWSPDGNLIASKSEDLTIKIWDAREGTLLRSLEGPKSPKIGVAFSPDGKVLALAGNDSEIRFQETKSGKDVWARLSHAGLAGFFFSPDGKSLASVGWGEKTLKLWEPQSGSLLRTMETPGTITAAAFSPDGKILASGGDDGLVKLWDRANGKELQSQAGKEGQVNAIVFSPDGRWVAAAQNTGLTLWPVRGR